MIADHPLLGFIEDAFAENDMEGYRNFRRTLNKKFPFVQLGVSFRSIDHMKNMTTWEPLNEEEQTTYNQQLEIKFPEAQRSDDFLIHVECPPIVGQKNIGKFTPHFAFLRSGALTTQSEFGAVFTYVGDLLAENQFGVVVDDRTYEDSSVTLQDSRL